MLKKQILMPKISAMLLAVTFVIGACFFLASCSQSQSKPGKTLGEASLVGSTASDPLLGGDYPLPGSNPPASSSNSGDDESTGTGYFAAARLNRQQSRDNALPLLQQAATDEEATQDMKDKANASIQTMASLTISEAQIENLVIAKGYQDCVAFIGDKSVSVVVAATENGLTDADVAEILEIVTEQTGFTASQIKIIEAAQ